ncbi:hypothetical protein [Ancylobacter amanitiformis]|uniref:HTH marR-type domain-containing protein n=1 Tax=Ancylobacter amanitiformis TaxID=217069 RepID=A0ABU0LV15_9HYPH|nr:hypothetical protein [Ancylobacter amanitiformis]MDQ0512572.1 hypothetical protein [Ancylobacter amanitiformis]
MPNELRFAGSGAFYDSARRGKPSQSASALPGRILAEMSKAHGAGAAAKEIAEAIGANVVEVAESLGALENLGLIVPRDPSPSNVRYILSPAGQRAHELAYLAIA